MRFDRRVMRRQLRPVMMSPAAARCERSEPVVLLHGGKCKSEADERVFHANEVSTLALALTTPTFSPHAVGGKARPRPSGAWK